MGEKIPIKIEPEHSPIVFDTTGEVTTNEDGTLSLDRIDAVHYNGYFLTFGEIPVSISTEHNGRYYETKHALLDKAPFEGHYGYSTDANLHMVNRRGAIRTACHEKVILQRGGHHSCESTGSFDVSLSGIGIYTDDKTVEMLEIGTECSISVMLQGQTLRLKGRLVRISPSQKEGIYHVGFELIYPPKEYTAYVMGLQRESARKVGFRAQKPN